MNILIVDDDVVVGRTLSRALGTLGHDTRRARSLEDALHAMAMERPELIFSDYDLGEFCTGVDLAVWARAAYDVPVVLITGHSVEDVRTELVHEHLTDIEVLSKPFTEEALRTAVARRGDVESASCTHAANDIRRRTR